MKPLLLIDIGNTRLKWRHVAGVWSTSDAHGSVVHLDQHVDLQQLSAQLATAWGDLLIAEVHIASVAAAATRDAVVRVLQQRTDVAIHLLTPSRSQCGVINAYARPEQLGADRWANLIATRALYPLAPSARCMIVSLGTATTIDLLHADGRCAGGVILPGLATMRRSLATQTAQLPDALGHYTPLADNTDDAIISGTLHAQCGAIVRVWRIAAPDEAAPLCVLTGGDAAQIAPLLPRAFQTRIEEQLVLRGLYEIAQHLHPSSE